MADSSILGSHLLSGIDDAQGNWPKIEFSSLLIVADLENLARTEAVSLVQDGEMVDPHGRKSHTDRRRLVLGRSAECTLLFGALSELAHFLTTCSSVPVQLLVLVQLFGLGPFVYGKLQQIRISIVLSSMTYIDLLYTRAQKEVRHNCWYL
jgi:hypothetical protein